jgi:hypothetical protein
MTEKRKGNNNGDSSDKKRTHKTHMFEKKLHMLKHIDNGERHGVVARSSGLSRSTVSIIVKNSCNYGTC